MVNPVRGGFCILVDCARSVQHVQSFLNDLPDQDWVGFVTPKAN